MFPQTPEEQTMTALMSQAGMPKKAAAVHIIHAAHTHTHTQTDTETQRHTPTYGHTRTHTFTRACSE